MRIRISIALTVVAGMLFSVVPASAIVYGEFDNNQHPNVGAYIVEIDGVYRRICSGTLIDSDTFLTAAHCVLGADGLGVDREDETYVTFDEIVSQGSTFLPGTAVPDPRYGTGGFNDSHDVGVIELDRPVRIAPAELPEEGLLDEMKSELRDQTFTAVGYGTIRENRKTGPQGILPNLRRRKALQSFQSLTGAWLTLSMNQATGDGGTCFGDSGGPHFLGGYESNLIVSLTVTGDAVCKATDKTYRLDTESARSFLEDYVALP